MKKMKIIAGALIMSLCCSMNISAQHTVLMKNGAKMNGEVQSIFNGLVSFRYNGNSVKYNLSDIATIYFNDLDKPSAAAVAAAQSLIPGGAGEKTMVAGSYSVRYKVGERTADKTPNISNLSRDKGTVLVNISIDKYGHVTKAEPVASGSTTTSEYLLTKAKQAAESTMFNNDSTAPLEEKGYMIIPF